MATLEGIVIINKALDLALATGEKWSVTIAGVTTDIDVLGAGRKGTGHIKISFVEDDV